MSPSVVHSFPAAHVLQLVELLQRWKIPAQELLQGTGLDEAGLATPHARISLELLIEVTERARALTAEPGIGFYLGLYKRLTMYGYLGFATMSAATVREGLELTVRYAPTVSTALGFDLRVEEGMATLSIEEHADLGSAHDVGIFSLLVGIRQLSTALTGRDPGRIQFDIPIAEPAYFVRFRHLLPDARFGQSGLRVHLDARALDQALRQPDRAALSLAREACERELAELGFDHDLPSRVRRLARSDGGVRGIEAVAHAMHLSTRTLKRRLADAGVSFSELVDADRCERAQQLLHRADLSMDQVAERLGYSSVPNFARAFRRWTGQTPAQHRKAGRS
jgi:AraC-like DNA-binding protein